MRLRWLGLGVQAAAFSFLMTATTVGWASHVRGGVVFTIVCALLAAVMAAAWVWWRISRPLWRIAQSATAFAAGDPHARVPASTYEIEVERLVRSVNHALEHVCRTQEMRAELDKKAIRTVVESIEYLGQAQLRAEMPTLRGQFEPVARALEQARQNLIERTQALHRASVAVIEEAATLRISLHSMAEAAQAQHGTLQRLASGAEETTDAVRRIEPSLETAAELVFLFGAEQRRWAEDTQDQLLELSRHCGEAREAAHRARGLLIDDAKLEQVFELLAVQTAGPDKDESRVAVLGESRTAQAKLRRELRRLCHDLGALSDSMERVRGMRPESVADLHVRTTEPFAGLGDVLIRGVELTAASMSSLERTSAKMHDSAKHGLDSLRRLRIELPRLATALAQVQIDGSFAESLLAALEEARKDTEQVDANGLTATGAAMLAEVAATASAARSRLAALIRTTDLAVSVLRVG